LLEANSRQNQYLLDAKSVMSNRQNGITSLHSRVLLFSDAAQTFNAVVDTKTKLKDIIAYEGKLSAIPKKVETIELVLHLSDELKKRGIATDKLDDLIKKASMTIGNNLEKLLAGEEQVELNGEIIALTLRSQQHLITNKQVKLIEQKAPD
jgi:hypothetical protein